MHRSTPTPTNRRHGSHSLTPQLHPLRDLLLNPRRNQPSRKPLRKSVRKATPSKLPPETFRTHQPRRPSFGALSESDAYPRKTPPLFEAFPKPYRMPPFEDSAEPPAGP